MNDAAQAFSPSYREAREKFLAAADRAGLDVHSHAHPLLGRDGEALAMDVARFGPPDAAALLILSSGCHGVEGFAGSAAQTALLGDADFHREAARASVGVLYVHALNPYGFSWIRRVTQENVDLNRNFVDFSRPLPENPGYDAIAHTLVPSHWPPTPQNEAALMQYAQAQGLRALQQAVTAGQYTHEQGLFFGGHNPTWSRQTLTHVLQDHAQHCRRLGWIDFHTGLGPQGHGERIFSGFGRDTTGFERAKAWWGPHVTSTTGGTSSAVELEGEMWRAAYELCPEAEYTGIALEFGTVSLEATIQALRAEQWAENHPELATGQLAEIKRQLRDAFYVDTDTWKQQVLAQAIEVARQGLQGLAQRAVMS
jgi:hypothetical protein